MGIGGGQIYEETLPLASRTYLTEVHASPEGDTRFPELDPAEWHEIRREPPVAGGAGRPASSIVVLELLVRPIKAFQHGCRGTERGFIMPATSTDSEQDRDGDTGVSTGGSRG